MKTILLFGLIKQMWSVNDTYEKNSRESPMGIGGGINNPSVGGSDR
jgi:hypothetical protein